MSPNLDLQGLRAAPLLLTGSGGVLGQALLRTLRARGYTQVLAPSRRELDLLDTRQTLDYFARHRPQAVIHLASLVFGLGGNLRHPFESLSANTQINSNLFQAVHAHPVQRLFFAGTVASYAYPYRALPLREEDLFEGLPHGGEFGYAMAKRHAFGYLSILAATSGLRFSYGIFTNLYGPDDRFDSENGHVVPSLVAKAWQAARRGDTSLEVWGDGSGKRDFLYADDAARAALLCLERADNQLVNIASGSTAAIGEVAAHIAAQFGIANLRFQSERPTGIAERSIDCSRLRSLGHVPAYDLAQGLRLTCDWFKTHHAEART